METLHRLRERFAFVPVVLLTAVEDPEIEASALRAGAQDFLGKDELTARTLRRVVRYAIERHRTQRDLVRLSTRDELTGLLNRRGFFMSAEPMARLAERAGRPFVVFFADLDGLKAINDIHGVVYLPESKGKTVISAGDPAVFSVVDTSVVRDRELLPAQSPLLAGLRADVDVEVGRDTWVRNKDANVEIFSDGPPSRGRAE